MRWIGAHWPLVFGCIAVWFIVSLLGALATGRVLQKVYKQDDD